MQQSNHATIAVRGNESVRASVVSEGQCSSCVLMGLAVVLLKVDVWQSHNPLPKSSQTPAASNLGRCQASSLLLNRSLTEVEMQFYLKPCSGQK